MIRGIKYNNDDVMEQKIIPPLLVYDGPDKEFLWQANGITKRLTICSGEDDPNLLTETEDNIKTDRLIKPPDDNTHIMKQSVPRSVKIKLLEKDNSNKTIGFCGNKEKENITLFHNNSLAKTTNLVLFNYSRPTNPTTTQGAVTGTFVAQPQMQNMYRLPYGHNPVILNIISQPTQTSNFHDITIPSNQNKVSHTLVDRQLANCRQPLQNKVSHTLVDRQLANCRQPLQTYRIKHVGQENNHQIKDLKQSKTQVSPVKKKSYPCSFCGKTFTLKRVLLQHSIIHSGERPYLCSFCSAVFNRKGNMERHEQIHTGETPYTCGCCGMKYRDKRALLRHEATKHNKQKQYRCSDCRARFYDIDVFRRHQTLHQKPQIYACTYCDNRYRDALSLIRHDVRKHESSMAHSCSYCGAKFVDNNHISSCKAQLQAKISAQRIPQPTMCKQSPHGYNSLTPN